MSGKCKATAKGTGQRCQAWAMAGAEVCRVHGGRAPQVKAAAKRRLAEQEAARLAAKVLDDPNAAPIVDVVTELQALAGRVRNAVDVIGARVNTLHEQEHLRYTDAKFAEQLRAEATIWAGLLKQFQSLLVDMARLGIEERRVVLSEQQGALLALAVRRVLEAFGLADDPRVPEVVPGVLREIGAGQ